MKTFRILCLALAALAAPALPLLAKDPAAAEKAISERLGQIDALKRDELIGENNQGYLEARETLTAPQQKVVDDENADRRVIYDDIAAAQGSSAADVGQQRAIQIARRSPAGAWLQNAQGRWYQK